jgi:aerobic-type carbon monoxide dehydrogenase small subunit (CoxS/CutS family)
MPEYSLTVNGRRHTVNVAADTPLLWVLRDTLGLTGTKFGCGTGQCRACAVHVGGAAVASCQLPVAGVAGRAITTIEGLGAEQLHPLQQAWIDEDVPQCGYCQSGQIMTAAHLLATNPTPSDAEIDEWMSVAICRCGTYNRIRRAIRRAAQGVSDGR